LRIGDKADPIVRESVIYNEHINKNQANWMSTYFSQHLVVDSTNRLDFRGLNDEHPFFNFNLNGLKLSYQDEFNSD
jgi:hypothetical protein